MKGYYHVIGYPVKHSLSPKIQMQLAEKYNQDMLFTAVEIATQDLEKKLLSLRIIHKSKV